jgi:hypothetical protein
MDSMDSTMNTTGSPKIGGTLQEPRKSGGLDDVDGHLHVQQSTPGSFKTGTGKEGCSDFLGFQWLGVLVGYLMFCWRLL